MIGTRMAKAGDETIMVQITNRAYDGRRGGDGTEVQAHRFMQDSAVWERIGLRLA